MTRPLQTLTVGDRMALDPIVSREDAPLIEAARLMDRHGVSGLPVVDRSGSLVGVLSQTDLLRARATEYLWANWPGLLVRHLMTAPALFVHRQTSLAEAARQMERHRVHRLVVVADVDDRLPIGVISVTDLVHQMAEDAAPPNPLPSEEPGIRPAPGSAATPAVKPREPIR